MRSILFFITFVALVATNVSYACTTAVISGKYTNDGRPLLWKLRDTGTDDNKLMYFDEGKFSFVGLVNSEDEAMQVWSGANEAGFAIMNSASFNIRENDTSLVRDREGVVMRMALENCATLTDFENFLDTLPRPMGLEANFGVIDANGGAAYYETSDFKYVKYDANSAEEAPLGYIIRTNYSNIGKANVGYGFIRFQTASELFYEAAGAGNINVRFLMNDVSRSLYNSLTDVDLYDNLPTDNSGSKYVYNTDCIVRYSTTASMTIQGVKKGEDPSLTTLWSIIGNPISSVTIPVWVNKNLPTILTASAKQHSQLCDWSLELKHKMYPISRGSGQAYMNMSVVANKQNTGIVQKIKPFEKIIYRKGEALLEKFIRKGKTNDKDLELFYNDVDDSVKGFYLNSLL
ncbi:MAG: carcinine hydrolase/isopenicillin-N N-acyltransferase family protein [Bacteroidota bacterium]|nr:carcinine hydrolase/isopenicillin-N N-acyltransferase family protein [Bacteroidota bacterium]